MTTNLTTIVSNDQLTMSSREIATLCEKRHDHVMRDIRKTLEELGIDAPRFGAVYFDAKNEQRTEYLLPKRETLILVSGYNIKMRAAIIDRWQELESQAQQNQVPIHQIPQTLHEALRLASELAEQKFIAEEERDEAIRTRHMIGSRREAQAMNLASQAAKKVKKLEAELDRSNEYATIKKMENIFNQKFSWRKLKATSEDLDIEVNQIPDKNYGTVNSYHRLVWLEAYGLDINISKAEAQKLILLEKLNALFDNE